MPYNSNHNSPESKSQTRVRDRTVNRKCEPAAGLKKHLRDHFSCSPCRFLIAGRLLLVSLVTMACWVQSSLGIADEKLNLMTSRRASQSNRSPEKTEGGSAEWTKNRSASSRAWNRAAARPEPLTLTDPAHATKGAKIHQVKAIGSEESEVAPTVEAEATVGSPGDTPAAPLADAIATPSLTVRQQFLNALQRKREATVTTPPLSTPGSLTIMNSPNTPSPPSTALKHEETPIETPGVISVEPPISVPVDSAVLPRPLQVGKSNIGLTLTLEADLQSTDPYVRDRAQRYLRLQKHLLKLKATHDVKAVQSTPRTVLPILSPAVEHAPQFSGVETSPPDTENHENASPENASSISPLDPAVSNLNPDNSRQRPTETLAATVEPNDDFRNRSLSTSRIEDIVVDGPIDRLSLANNLFATGQLPLALEMYQEIAPADVTTQQHFWVDYQTANCQERLGNRTEALNRYRKLAGHPEAGWLSRRAHWCAELIEQIRSLEKSLKSNSIEKLEAIVGEVENSQQIKNADATPASSSPLEKEATHDAPAD